MEHTGSTKVTSDDCWQLSGSDIGHGTPSHVGERKMGGIPAARPGSNNGSMGTPQYRLVWTTEEVNALTQLYEEHKKTLFHGNMKCRVFAWNRITDRFNQQFPNRPKTMPEMRNKWRHLVYSVRNSRCAIDKSIRAAVLKLWKQKKEVMNCPEMSAIDFGNDTNQLPESTVGRPKPKRRKLKTLQQLYDGQEEGEVSEVLVRAGEDEEVQNVSPTENNESSMENDCLLNDNTHMDVGTSNLCNEQLLKVKLDLLELQRAKLLMEMQKLELEKAVLQKQEKKLDKETLYWQKMLLQLTNKGGKS